MSGATPLFLSTAFILEEGTALADLGRIAEAMGAAARAAGVRLVTGDTKVVDSGSGDGVYVNTAGVGVVPDGVDISPRRARPGDVVLVSGDIGVHGVAVMSCREGLEFGTTIAQRHRAAARAGRRHARHRRRPARAARPDPRRGGGVAERDRPGVRRRRRARSSGTCRSRPTVRDACSLLGLDPLQVANEGKLLAFVPADAADAVLAAMRAHPHGAGARSIGTCVDEHPGMVVRQDRARRHPGRRPADR